MITAEDKADNTHKNIPSKLLGISNYLPISAV